jgi:hypothetical protein
MKARKPRDDYSVELASRLTDIAIAAYAEEKADLHTIASRGAK